MQSPLRSRSFPQIQDGMPGPVDNLEILIRGHGNRKPKNKSSIWHDRFIPVWYAWVITTPPVVPNADQKDPSCIGQHHEAERIGHRPEVQSRVLLVEIIITEQRRQSN